MSISQGVLSLRQELRKSYQMTLPPEILDKIALYLPYEKAVSISPFAKSKLGDISNPFKLWRMYITEGNLYAAKWFYFNKNTTRKKL